MNKSDKPKNNSQRRREDRFMSHISGNKPKPPPRKYYLHQPHQDKYGKSLPQTVSFPQKPLPTKRRGGPGNEEREHRFATATKEQRLANIQDACRKRQGWIRCSDGRLAKVHVHTTEGSNEEAA